MMAASLQSQPWFQQMYGNQVPAPAHYAPEPAPYVPQPAPEPVHYNPEPARYVPQPAPYAPQPAHYTPQPAPYVPEPVVHEPYDEPAPAHYRPEPAYTAPEPAYQEPATPKYAPEPPVYEEERPAQYYAVPAIYRPESYDMSHAATPVYINVPYQQAPVMYVPQGHDARVRGGRSNSYVAPVYTRPTYRTTSTYQPAQSHARRPYSGDYSNPAFVKPTPFMYTSP